MKYTLITAARNEQEHIESVLLSVKKQTILPENWFICLNGTEDNTENIIKEYLQVMPFIKILNIHDYSKPDFSKKVRSIKKGYEKVKGTETDIVGIIDADVSFSPDFCELILGKFMNDPMLGVATGDLLEKQCNGNWVVRKFQRELAVTGCAQFFRRECYEMINGYREIPTGGEDTIAAVMAKVQGWNTYIFEDIQVFHNRKMSSRYSTLISNVPYKEGLRDSKLGMHPVFAFAKTIYRLKKDPFIFDSFFWLLGYITGVVSGTDTHISPECKKYLQNMQTRKLLSFITKK